MKTCIVIFLSLLPLFCKAQLPWKSVDTNVALIAYSMASTDSGNVFICENGKLYRSTKNGDSGTFFSLSTIPAIGNMSEVYAYGQYVYLLNKGSAKSTGIWRSGDEGVSWTQYKNGFTASDLKHLEGIVLIDSGCIVVLVYDGQSPNKFYVSNDQGVTWNLRLTISGYAPKMVNIVRKDSTLYLFQHYYIYTSVNNGISWTYPVAVGYYPTSILYKTVVLSNGKFIMKTGNLIMSSSNGYSWKQVAATGIPGSSWQTTNLLKSPHSDTLYMTTSDGITMLTLMSSDNGVTWNKFDNGLPSFVSGARLYYAQQFHLSNNGYLFLTADHSSVYRTTDRVTKPFTEPKPITPTDTPTHAMNTENMSLALNIYPNPVTGVMNVSFFQERYGSSNITVRSILGYTAIIIQLQAAKGYRNYQVDMSNLPAGVYILNISTPIGNAAQKFVKE